MKKEYVVPQTVFTQLNTNDVISASDTLTGLTELTEDAGFVDKKTW